MTTEIQSRTIFFEDGETVALDLRNSIWPMGFTIRPASGTTVTRKASNGNRPGNKFANPPANDSLTSNFNFGQMDPISFASFSATSGDAHIDVSAFRALDIVVHNSVLNTVSAQTVPSQSVAVGESITINARDLFEYDIDGQDWTSVLDLSATSAATGTATAVVDPEGGDVTITGVAAGTVNVTVVANTPAEDDANVAIAVTVTS